MRFAQHETFHIRDGWLNKGLHAIAEDAHIFRDDEAPQRLGLGKNMVRSLRYWMMALGLVETIGRQQGLRLTQLGHILLENDPYQERDGTLWLLHHQLVKNSAQATAWYWFFNLYVPRIFTRQEFLDNLNLWINANMGSDSKPIAPSSLAKDFDCILHTYAPNSREYSPEDLMESPLSALNLLSAIHDKDEQDRRLRYYRLNVPTTSSIPPLILLYVLLDFRETRAAQVDQLNLSDIMRQPGGPGRTFNITTSAFEELIMAVADIVPEYSVTITRTAGLNLVNLPRIAPQDVLKSYYYSNSYQPQVIEKWSLSSS
ncbi:MAG: DUF4007 family protein [Anaerolineae bacterium]|nr:DUF4007 family protein [Anaerolineae bacterium]MDW8172085.1 DUF4007 family protein [Anaerolineae bacterium]